MLFILTKGGIAVASLSDIKATINGVVYHADEFIDPVNVESIETGNGITVVTMINGEEFHFSANEIRRRESRENEIPRPYVPNIEGKDPIKERKSMANMTIDRIDSNNPLHQGGQSMTLEQALVTERLVEWASSYDFPDSASLEDVFAVVKTLPDLTAEEQKVIDDLDSYFAENRQANSARSSSAGSAGSDSEEFAVSANFNEGAQRTRSRRTLSAAEQQENFEQFKREVADLESTRSPEDQAFIEKLKAYLAPNGFIPILLPVTRNNSRLGVKTINTIPASKRRFADSVSEDVRSQVTTSTIPTNLAYCEYKLEFFETNPTPLLGVLAYLPSNFEPSSLESLSTSNGRSKIETWMEAHKTSKDIRLRWVDKESLLYMMVATGLPGRFVEKDKYETASLKNLEFFFKRLHKVEENHTWFNVITRDTATGKARKSTSAGYIPLYTFIQGVPTGDQLNVVSNQLIGANLFNPLPQGKGVAYRFLELLPEAVAKIDGSTRETFVLKDLRNAKGVTAISHRNRRDAPETVTMLPPVVEHYKTSAGVDKTRFAKESFLSYRENSSKSRFDKAFTGLVNAYGDLLQEAHKRKSRITKSSQNEIRDTLASTNELLQGLIPQLGSKKPVR